MSVDPIYIVDDNSAVRDALTFLLEAGGLCDRFALGIGLCDQFIFYFRKGTGDFHWFQNGAECTF
jgi:hypothetical protein